MYKPTLLPSKAMEDFSLPVLVNSITFNSPNSNKNNLNTNHINTQMHHHKDQMLAAGSTPSTTAFLYEAQSAAKPEMTMAKSDYATFTSCIQQSALLDHRVDTNLETNLDGAVSLGGLGLCDLKFANTSNLMGGNNTTVLCTDVNNYKHLPPLPIIESNSLFATSNGGELTKGSASPTSITGNLQATFSNIVHFNRDPLPEELPSTQSHYVTFKESEESNTAEHPQKILGNVNTQMPPPPSTGSTDENCGAGLMEFTIESTDKSPNLNNLHEENVVVNVTAANAPTIAAMIKNTANTNTTVITTMASIATTTSNINVNLQQQQQQQNVSSSVHSVEEVGLNSMATTRSSSSLSGISSSAVSSIASPSLNPSPSSVANVLSTATSVPTQLQQQQQQQQQQHDNHHPRSVQTDQQNHQNCSNISTDSNDDSLSSSEEFLEMDLNGRASAGK
ncbi:hypothetical protein GQX74_004351 [Glossina fuscipes]|nr:hypothetical protein GQX74_004351 [Glossina fuscipes]